MNSLITSQNHIERYSHSSSNLTRVNASTTQLSPPSTNPTSAINNTSALHSAIAIVNPNSVSDVISTHASADSHGINPSQLFESNTSLSQPNTEQYTNSVDFRGQSGVDSRLKEKQLNPLQSLGLTNLRNGASDITGIMNVIPTQTSNSDGSAIVDTINEAPDIEIFNRQSIIANDDDNASLIAADSDSAVINGLATNDDSSNQQQVEKQQQAELQVIKELSQRDAEVRQHEKAHAAAGGQHAGHPSYEYDQGPDGRRYAVEGEVQIDVSPIAGDHQATIDKMQQVYSAALAPVQPSIADIKVAVQALQQLNDAKQALSEERQQQVSDNDQSARINELGQIFKTADDDNSSQLDPYQLEESNKQTLYPYSPSLASRDGNDVTYVELASSVSRATLAYQETSAFK